uniref:ROK family protein n=1 Tax=Schlesneria paludicola TaxID=360056 RepID=A0A7C4LJ58_9PLAN
MQYLGIEIGGTKLQLGVGPGDGQTFTEFVRLDVDRGRGAAGILEQIQRAGQALVARHAVQRVGYGFGGPVFGARGVVQKSHQVSGWDDFPLVEWTVANLGVPARLGNDCDVAALAEACYGAGASSRCVFYVTVGTGIGGGLVIERKIHGTDRPAAAEIGHLRPGLAASSPDQTVEAIAAGPGIETRLQRVLNASAEQQPLPPEVAALLAEIGGEETYLTARQIAEHARGGNRLAREVYREATEVLGWAIAQAITLLAPDVVIVGGGVSLAGETLFFEPLRAAVARYVFPPLLGHYRLVPAQLGESVVVHGALALAAAP